MGRERAVQTRGAEKPKASVMAAPVRAVVYLVRIEDRGWRRFEGGEGELPGERCPLVAHFSNGKVYERDAIVYYERGERERLFEAIADQSKATDDLVLQAQAILLRRKKAVADVRRALQRMFGKPGQFHTCVLRDPADAA